MRLANNASNNSNGNIIAPKQQRLVLAYGINDCEGAATYIDLDVVEGLLQDVPSGKEVIDLLMPLPPIPPPPS